MALAIAEKETVEAEAIRRRIREMTGKAMPSNEPAKQPTNGDPIPSSLPEPSGRKSPFKHATPQSTLGEGGIILPALSTASNSVLPGAPPRLQARLATLMGSSPAP
jgi:hypothetical protein